MKSKYDVIIIGAGIGGLACGLYLAKEGLKVLIIEQHKVAGGYCTSFKRKSFIFNTSIHYLGSCRENGWIGKFLLDHDLFSKITMLRSDPSDVVMFGGIEIPFFNEIGRSVRILQEKFPAERESVANFFNFIKNSSFLDVYAKLKNISFQQMLNSFFKDDVLKNIFSLLTGNTEVPPDKLSALSAYIVFREFILDGGYQPKGGMQIFPDALVNKFLYYGGDILFSQKVEKILIRNGIANGVSTKREDICSNIVVANCDAHQLFCELVPLPYRRKEVLQKIKRLQVSSSSFVMYLGLKEKLNKVVNYKCSTWFLPSGNLSSAYNFFNDNSINFKDDFILCSFPSFNDQSLAPDHGETLFCVMGAPFLNKEYWKKHRQIVGENLINRVEKLIPNIKDVIEVEETATPCTFNRYTSNYNGAISGWANLVDQTDESFLPAKTYLNNLYTCGHWTTSGFGQGGVAMVVYSGSNTAKKILKELK